jgi:hypothetical protein
LRQFVTALLVLCLGLGGCSGVPAETPATTERLHPGNRLRTKGLGFESSTLDSSPRKAPILLHGEAVPVAIPAGYRAVSAFLQITNPHTVTSETRVTTAPATLLTNAGAEYRPVAIRSRTVGVVKSGQVSPGSGVEIFEVFVVKADQEPLRLLWNPIVGQSRPFEIWSTEGYPPEWDKPSGPAG